MEWEVWLADGSTRDSARHEWDDESWDGVLVMRWWKPPQKGICWGDSNYGLSSTVKNGAIVARDVFARAMKAAQAATAPPSKRGAG